MAYIEEFTVTGLAGRSEPIHRKLDRHVNVFWGLNGAGKTSLLKILHSALRSDTSLLKRVPFQSAEVVFRSTDHNSTMRRSISKPQEDDWSDSEDPPSTSLEQVGEGLWQEVAVASEVSWKTTIISGALKARPDAPFKHTYLPISRMTRSAAQRPYGSPSGSRASAVDDAYLDEEFAEQVRRKWQEYNSEALGTVRAIQQQGLANTLAILFGGAAGHRAKLTSGVTSQEAYGLVSHFLREQGIRLRLGEGEFVTRYEKETDLRQVVATIQRVAEDVDKAFRPQQEFQAVVENLYSGDKKVLFDRSRFSRQSLHVELNGTTIPLQSLSSGEKQLLRLMLEVLAALICDRHD